MERKQNDDRRAAQEHEAQRRLRELGAGQIKDQPWRPNPVPPSATDLVQFALWKSADLPAEDLVRALSLLPAMRAEAEAAEAGLLFVARAERLTWAQIADAMGFRSPQACQQHFNRLTSRNGGA